MLMQSIWDTEGNDIADKQMPSFMPFREFNKLVQEVEGSQRRDFEAVLKGQRGELDSQPVKRVVLLGAGESGKKQSSNSFCSTMVH